METSENTSRKLQNKMESLQNLVESSQIKNQGASITKNIPVLCKTPTLSRKCSCYLPKHYLWFCLRSV